jgi:hypothetical protein
MQKQGRRAEYNRPTAFCHAGSGWAQYPVPTTLYPVPTTLSPSRDAATKVDR